LGVYELFSIPDAQDLAFVVVIIVVAIDTETKTINGIDQVVIY